MSYLSNEGSDRTIACINDNTTIGYKYMNFKGETELTLNAKCDGEGTFEIYTDGDKVGEMEYNNCSSWTQKSLKFDANGTMDLAFKFRGTGVAEVMSFSF